MHKMKDLKDKGSRHDGTKRQKDLLKKVRSAFKRKFPGSKKMRAITIVRRAVW